MSSAYSNWDRDLATTRALQAADNSRATDNNCIYNFAFGSNLNPTKVKSRNMSPKEVLRGFLPEWQLLFNHIGGYGNIEQTAVIQELNLDVSRLQKKPSRRSRTATTLVQQQPPEEVHGVLLKLSRKEFAQMAWEEYAYNTVEVPVVVYPEDDTTGSATRIQWCLAFKTSEVAITDSTTLPSKRYIRLIQQGARESGIAEQYCQWLEGIPSA